MQCNWPPLARLAFRGFARPWPHTSRTIHTSLHSLPTPCTPPLRTPNPSFNFLLSPHCRQYSALQTKSKTPPTSENLPQPSHVPSAPIPAKHMEPEPQTREPGKSSLSYAQMSQTAAKAVRLSVQNGSLADAYLIVRSLFHARLSDPAKATPFSVQRFLGEIEGTAIPFDKRVSPRLSAHTLVHSLLRIGEHQQAARLAEQMLDTGTRMRGASLEAVLRALRDASADAPPQLLAPILSLKALESTQLRPHMRGNAELTGAALALVQAARRAGQRSTRRMYRYLLTLCIINGEIILASLLFGVLLRDWQAREQAVANGLPALAPLAPAAAKVAPPPELGDLKKILAFVNWNLAAPQTDASSKRAFSASLQALVNLAYAMDQGCVPINLEPLIAAMYKCPRTKEQVLRPPAKEGGAYRSVEAFQYVHYVLDNLIFSLPDSEYGPRNVKKRKKKGKEKPKREVQKSEAQAPSNNPEMDPLNPWAFNTLLNYTLRYQHSIKRAKLVLARMIQHPDAQLPENLALMHNILDRAEKEFPPGAIDKLIESVGLSPRETMSLSALVDVPDAELDPYALSTHITTLVYSGQVNVVIDALPSILPGLSPPPVPKGTPIETSYKIASKHRNDGLQRAVALGPVVFCSLLNALRKDGKTGSAEKVFLHALEAEERSFVPQPQSGDDDATLVQPWCLPVHAYTTMVQLYDNELHKARVGKPHAAGWGLTDDGERITHDPDAPLARPNLAHRMIVLMYRTMMAAPSAIARRLADLSALASSASSTGKRKIKINIGPDRLVPPQPDRWFFESMFDIFAERPKDPVFPALVLAAARAGHGDAVSSSAREALRRCHGEQALLQVVEELKGAQQRGARVVERRRQPVGMLAGKRPGERLASARLGWKSWNLERGKEEAGI